MSKQLYKGNQLADISDAKSKYCKFGGFNYHQREQLRHQSKKTSLNKPTVSEGQEPR